VLHTKGCAAIAPKDDKPLALCRWRGGGGGRRRLIGTYLAMIARSTPVILGIRAGDSLECSVSLVVFLPERVGFHLERILLLVFAPRPSVDPLLLNGVVTVLQVRSHLGDDDDDDGDNDDIDDADMDDDAADIDDDGANDQAPQPLPNTHARCLPTMMILTGESYPPPKKKTQLPFLLLLAVPFAWLGRPHMPVSSVPDGLYDGTLCLVGFNSLVSDAGWRDEMMMVVLVLVALLVMMMMMMMVTADGRDPVVWQPSDNCWPWGPVLFFTYSLTNTLFTIP
jgi:hypothetical protein